MNRMMDRLEELEVIVQGERGRIVQFTNPPSLRKNEGLSVRQLALPPEVDGPPRQWKNQKEDGLLHHFALR